MLRTNARLKKYSVLYTVPSSPDPIRVEMLDFSKSGAALRLPQGAQVLEMVEIEERGRRDPS